MIGERLGHSDIEMTARYTHMACDSVRAAAEGISDSIAIATLQGRRAAHRTKHCLAGPSSPYPPPCTLAEPLTAQRSACRNGDTVSGL